MRSAMTADAAQAGRRIAADTSDHTIAGEAARSPEPQAQGVADKGERAIFFL